MLWILHVTGVVMTSLFVVSCLPINWSAPIASLADFFILSIPILGGIIFGAIFANVIFVFFSTAIMAKHYSEQEWIETLKTINNKAKRFYPPFGIFYYNLKLARKIHRWLIR